MARLNVEDEWFITDPRRPILIGLVGDAFKADGMALAAWRLAQRYWKEIKKPIPEDIWELSGLEPLIQCKLARRIEGGIYVAGTKEAFEWLDNSADSGRVGGKKSAEIRRQKYGTAQPPKGHRRGPSDKTEGAIEDSDDDDRRVPEGGFEQNPEGPNPLPPPQSLSPPLKENKDTSLKTSGNPQAGRQQPRKAGRRQRRYRFDEATHGALAEWMIAAVQSRNFAAFKIDYANRDAWANELRLLEEVDGVPPEQAHKIMLWALDHNFWRTRVQSPDSLRKSWGELRKQFGERRGPIACLEQSQ